MKRLFAKILSSWLVISVFVASVPACSQAVDSGYTIYTRITNIDLPPSLIFYGSYPNHTFFEFWYTAEIINPSEKNLYIMTPTTCLTFINENLSFENESYDGFVWGDPKLCGQSITNHTIEPGILEGQLTFELSVNDTLKTLPNGNFTVWIQFHDYLEEHEYIYFKSTIAVNDSNITITHEGADVIFTFPSVSALPKEISIFLTFLVIGLPIIFLVRKRSQMV